MNENLLMGELGCREADLVALGRFLVVCGGLRDTGT